MGWNTKWNADQRAKAKQEGRSLYIVGTDGPIGRWEQAGVMDNDEATFLFVFTAQLYRGLTPREAFDEATRLIAEDATKSEGGAA